MIGQTLKHYRVEAMIGKGGMGVVYKARDTRLDRPVALKMLPPELLSNPNRRKRFLLEVRSAAAISHPAIAQVYDIDEIDGNMVIAMEFIDGRTVSRLVNEGELDLLGAVEVALQIADGLAKLLELSDEEPDIAPQDLSRTLTRGLTMPGAVMGTISYMSPEQARGKELDPRSDIFSLGIVLYEMVTSELPFKGETPLDTMHAIAYEEARPVTIVRRNLTPELHRIVFRCLRKRSEDRYPDARALAEDLRRLKHDVESGTRTHLPAGERLRGWVDWLRTSFPFGPKGLAVLTGAVALTVALVALRINWGGLIGPAFIALFAYRFIRNRKKRLITALIEEINGRLYVGKRVTAEIKTDLEEGEFQALLRQMGIVYARDDVVVGRTATGKTGGRRRENGIADAAGNLEVPQGEIAVLSGQPGHDLQALAQARVSVDA